LAEFFGKPERAHEFPRDLDVLRFEWLANRSAQPRNTPLGLSPSLSDIIGRQIRAFRLGYNRGVRIVSASLLILCLAGCNRGSKDNAEVRQGVMDYLSQRAGMNLAAMDVTLTSVKVNGNQADATVAFAAKGAGATQMTMQYHLEQKDNKWTVVGRQDSSQHTTATPAPGGGNPHGGMAPPPGGGAVPGASNPHGAMPAPEDLPPAGQKK
jgi:hypothetical protein